MCVPLLASPAEMVILPGCPASAMIVASVDVSLFAVRVLTISTEGAYDSTRSSITSASRTLSHSMSIALLFLPAVMVLVATSAILFNFSSMVSNGGTTLSTLRDWFSDGTRTMSSPYSSVISLLAVPVVPPMSP